MDLQELLNMLELDQPEDFEYFENFADLVESDEDIPEDTLFQLFSGTEAETVAEIIDNYFEETLEGVPDDEVDFYTLLEQIRRSLIGMIRGRDEESIVHFSEALGKFKTWYSFESEVTCHSIEGGEDKVLPIRDALTLARLEKLDEEEYRYDFSACLDYELEDYAVELADLGDSSESEDLMASGYVYDDELNN